MENSSLSVFQTPKLNFGTPSTWDGSPILDRKVWREHAQPAEGASSSPKSSEKSVSQRRLFDEEEFFPDLLADFKVSTDTLNGDLGAEKFKQTSESRIYQTRSFQVCQSEDDSDEDRPHRKAEEEESARDIHRAEDDKHKGLDLMVGTQASKLELKSYDIAESRSPTVGEAEKDRKPDIEGSEIDNPILQLSTPKAKGAMITESPPTILDTEFGFCTPVNSSSTRSNATWQYESQENSGLNWKPDSNAVDEMKLNSDVDFRHTLPATLESGSVDKEASDPPEDKSLLMSQEDSIANMQELAGSERSKEIYYYCTEVWERDDKEKVTKADEASDEKAICTTGSISMLELLDPINSNFQQQEQLDAQKKSILSNFRRESECLRFREEDILARGLRLLKENQKDSVSRSADKKDEKENRSWMAKDTPGRSCLQIDKDKYSMILASLSSADNKIKELAKENDRLARELKTVSVDRDYWREKLRERLRLAEDNGSEYFKSSETPPPRPQLKGIESLSQKACINMLILMCHIAGIDDVTLLVTIWKKALIIVETAVKMERIITDVCSIVFSSASLPKDTKRSPLQLTKIIKIWERDIQELQKLRQLKIVLVNELQQRDSMLRGKVRPAIIYTNEEVGTSVKRLIEDEAIAKARDQAITEVQKALLTSPEEYLRDILQHLQEELNATSPDQIIPAFDKMNRSMREAQTIFKALRDTLGLEPHEPIRRVVDKVDELRYSLPFTETD